MGLAELDGWEQPEVLKKQGLEQAVGFTVKDSGQRESFDTGAVRDVREGKGRFDLISPIALVRLARHYESGAKKYGDNNYRKGMPLRRILDSALRHINAYQMGDREEDHLIAAAWNLFTIVELQYMISKGMLPKELDDLAVYEAPAA